MTPSTTLPAGWTKSTLGGLCDVITDGTHYTPRYVTRGVPFYSVENVTANNFRQVKQISVEEHRMLVRRCRPQRGDILMTRIGSLGDTRLIDWDVDASIYVSLALLRPGRRTDPLYLYAYTKSAPFVQDVEDRSLLWAIPKKINMGDIGSVPVSYPVDPAEQAAIGQAISEVSAATAALERLLAKKEAVNHGMLQQLLTGETRLPGWVTPWTEVVLGDAVSYVKTVALSRAQLDETSSVRYLHYGDIHTSERATLDAAHESMPRASASVTRDAGRLKRGDLVFVDASEDPAGVGKAVEITSLPTDGLVPGLHTIAARFDKLILADGFKAYVQFIPAFRAALLRLAAGTKVLATTRTHISSVVLSLPHPDEQRAIASVLNDADREIDVLRERLGKARAVKQGMTQQLLTGRTRLPVTEVAA